VHGGKGARSRFGKKREALVWKRSVYSHVSPRFRLGLLRRHAHTVVGYGESALIQIRPDRNAAVGAQRTELEDRIARVLDKFAHHDQTAERAIQGVISKCA